MSKLKAFIEAMPKCELHVHIEGTLEPEMKFQLAKRNGVKLPYKNEKALKAAYDFDDLPSFLAVYYEGMSVLLTEQDFYDVTLAYLRKARSQNVRYAEMFFDPQAHTARGVTFDTDDAVIPKTSTCAPAGRRVSGSAPRGAESSPAHRLSCRRAYVNLLSWTKH